MKPLTVAIILKLEDGNCYQVILKKENDEYIFGLLKQFFPDGKIHVRPEKLALDIEVHNETAT